jgi:hypothetical protein
MGLLFGEEVDVDDEILELRGPSKSSQALKFATDCRDMLAVLKENWIGIRFRRNVKDLESLFLSHLPDLSTSLLLSFANASAA